MTIEQIIMRTLNIPVVKEPSPLLPNCATYTDYYTGAGLEGDGFGQEWISSCQVDLWYRNRAEFDAAVNKLLRAIGPPEYSVPAAEKNCDPSTKLWRAIIKFERVEGDACEW